MSKAGKFLFLAAGISLAALMIVRTVYGGWLSGMWAPLALFVIFFTLGAVKDFRALKEFFTMRTTKHGANMGVLILMTVAGLACVNFLAARYEKKFDWTSEGLNSLSDQSIKTAKALTKETEIVMLYRKGQQANENPTRAVSDLVQMYQNVNKNIKFTPYNALQRPDLAQKYEFAAGNHVVYAVQGERKVKVDPTTEEGMTRALIKLGREKKKVLYFTAGHGEANLEERGENGISSVKDELGVTYDVKPLTIYQAGDKIPDDAEAVAIIRPQQKFLDSEMNALREYARKGGHLLIAIDPGAKHNLAQLTKTFGVEFQNNFVIVYPPQVREGGPTMIVGTEFNKGSEITRAFDPGMYAIFMQGSALAKAPDAPKEFTIDELVKTSPQTMAINEVKERIEYKPNGPHTLAISVKGRMPAAGKDEKAAADAKEFSAVIFGDSDFMSNMLVHNGPNRDLAMNSFAWLTSDKDLISIRPKEPKGTKLVMTDQTFKILLLAFIIPLPLLMFLAGGVVWWRRRTA